MVGGGANGAFLMQVAMVYLDEGCLPADPAKLAFRTGLPLNAIQELSAFWEHLGRVEGDTLVLDFAEEILAERRQFAEKKASSGAKGGSQAKPSKTKQDEAEPSKAKQNQAIHTDIQTNKQEGDARESAATADLSASQEQQAYQAAASARPSVPQDQGTHDFDVYLAYLQEKTPGKLPAQLTGLARKLKKTGEDDQAVTAWQALKAKLPPSRAPVKVQGCECNGSGYVFHRGGLPLNPPEDCVCQGRK
jgi:uncharacterized protein YdaU (DUF1376 family)